MYSKHKLKADIEKSIESNGSLYAAAKRRNINRGTLWRVYYNEAHEGEWKAVAKAYGDYKPRRRWACDVPEWMTDEMEERFRDNMCHAADRLIDEVLRDFSQ